MTVNKKLICFLRLVMMNKNMFTAAADFIQTCRKTRSGSERRRIEKEHTPFPVVLSDRLICWRLCKNEGFFFMSWSHDLRLHMESQGSSWFLWKSQSSHCLIRWSAPEERNLEPKSKSKWTEPEKRKGATIIWARSNHCRSDCPRRTHCPDGHDMLQCLGLWKLWKWNSLISWRCVSGVKSELNTNDKISWSVYWRTRLLIGEGEFILFPM